MDPRKRRPDPSFSGNRPLGKRNKYQNDVPTHPSKHSAPGRRGISSSQSLLRRSSGADPSGMPMKPPSTTESMQNPGNHGRPSQYGQSQATSGAERPREPSIGNSSVVTVSPEGLENRTPTTMERAPPVPSMMPQAPGAIVGPNLRENPSISHPNHSNQRARATNTDLPHTLASLQRMKARKAAMSQKSSELAPDQLYTQIGELRRQFAEEREERNKERVEMSNQIKSLQNQLAIEQTQRSNDSGRLEKLETTISTHLESTAKTFEATKSFAAVSAEVKAHSNDINSFKAWKESQTSRAMADQNADAVRSHVDQQAVTKLQERMDKLNAEVLEKFEMYSSQHKRDMAKLSQENSQSSSGLKEKHDRILAQEQSLSKLNSRLSDIEKTNDQSAIDTVTENLNTLISAIDKTEEDLHDLRINMTALKDGIPQSFVRLLDPMRAELQQKFKYINTKMDHKSKEITQAMKETQAKAIERMKGLMVDEDQKLSNRVESGLDGLQRQLNDIMVAYVNDNMELFRAWPSIVCAMIEIQKVIRDLNQNSDPAKRLKIQWTDVGDLMNQIKYTVAKR